MEIVKYFGLSEPELRMFWENANSFCSLLWDVLKSLSDRANDIKHVKIHCSTQTHYVCVTVLCSILKNNPECKYFFYYFKCILDRVRGLSREPVHWGSVFCCSPSDVTLYPFSFDLHRSSTAIDKREK